jgi:hypothetical protein
MARSVKIHAELLDSKTKEILAAMQEDLANLRASYVALTAKLDLDATVTDTNYASLTNPPALKTQA